MDGLPQITDHRHRLAALGAHRQAPAAELAAQRERGERRLPVGREAVDDALERRDRLARVKVELKREARSNDEFAARRRRIIDTNPELRERLSGEALEPMPMTPEQFGQYIRDDIARWSKLAKDRNIQISE